MGKINGHPMRHQAKRSITLSDGRKTSVSLETAFFEFLRDAAKARGMTFSALVEEVAAANRTVNLSSALRVYALGLARGPR